MLIAGSHRRSRHGLPSPGRSDSTTTSTSCTKWCQQRIPIQFPRSTKGWTPLTSARPAIVRRISRAASLGSTSRVRRGGAVGGGGHTFSIVSASAARIEKLFSDATRSSLRTRHRADTSAIRPFATWRRSSESRACPRSKPSIAHGDERVSKCSGSRARRVCATTGPMGDQRWRFSRWTVSTSNSLEVASRRGLFRPIEDGLSRLLEARCSGCSPPPQTKGIGVTRVRSRGFA
jgi:hypothetical protein